MKSLVEEASSITKAIEKAWTRAGKPQSFSVKIFENPESGFLGLTTKKSAKVGIFFEETAIEKPNQRPYSRSSSSNNRRPERSRSNDRPNRSSESNSRTTGRRSESRGQGARPQRSNDRPPRDNDRSKTRDDRPPRRRENDRPSARPQRSNDRPPRRTDLRQEKKPSDKPAAPKVDTPSPLTSSAPTVKKAPRISGRRFSGHKKTEDK